MKLIVAYRNDVWKERVVEKYARSVVKEFKLRGHQVLEVGPGHTHPNLDSVPVDTFDHLLELDVGRDEAGEFCYLVPKAREEGRSLPRCSVWWIDSHGYPSFHKRNAHHYDHVFFAVWSRRDLFVRHGSSHWLPNATDLQWFGYRNFVNTKPEYDFGFFGSKGGLHRADPLKAACSRNGWSYDIRQINRSSRHMWPYTGEAMAACRNLFNHGQKHDGPNLRVMESMAMKRPLLTDLDDRDGMAKLFVDGYHYIGYESYTYADLEEKCKWVLDNPEKAAEIAERAYQEVRHKHTIGNRVESMLDVLCYEK